MKIGYLLQTFPRLTETFITNEIRTLEKMGHQVCLGAIHRPGDGIPSCYQDLADRTLYWYDIDKRQLPRILKVNLKRYLSSPLRYLKAQKLASQNKWPCLQLFKLVTLADYFIENEVSHIHTHFAWSHIFFLKFINRLNDIPFSVTLHAADIYMEDDYLEDAVSSASFVITISNYNKNYLVEQRGFPGDKIHVVHCGINPKLFKCENVQSNEVPLILSVGRLVEKKGFDILLKALSILKNNGELFQAVIVGNGPLYSDLIQLSDKLGLKENVTFTGPLESSIVRSYLFKCDLFVLPCKRATNGDVDGIPVVLMEAMACGKPVISSAISGIPELIKDGENGILIQENNIHALAAKIAILINDKRLSKKLGEQGRETVIKDFSLENQVKGLLSIL